RPPGPPGRPRARRRGPAARRTGSLDAQALPARAVGGAAAPRAHRRGDRPGAGAADRRRADRQPGRDRTGADPRSSRPSPARARDVGAADHPRPRGRRPDVRAGPRDARRANRRIGRDAPVVCLPPASVYPRARHGRAAARHLARMSGEGGTGRDRLPVLAPLRHRNLRLFFAGQGLSLVGTWMQTVGQAWLVLDLTHSPFLLGVINALQWSPVLLLSLPAGAVVDRVPKRV